MNVRILNYSLLFIFLSLAFHKQLPGEEFLLRARIYPESWYQDNWCQAHDGSTEVYLADSTRADCVTSLHIIEFDFADKWYESVAQSLHYALNFKGKRKPGIVLIIEDSAVDEKYWDRLNTLLDAFYLPVDTWAYGNTITERFNERTDWIKGDVSGDNRIGMEEAIHALKMMGGFE
ncbi:MAG: hypothetical protein HQK75_12320 [Candidatus Magnetomorum sp.]|nr:hypothetical protein [Candidatus Magnetomorum sp.]